MFISFREMATVSRLFYIICLKFCIRWIKVCFQIAITLLIFSLRQKQKQTSLIFITIFPIKCKFFELFAKTLLQASISALCFMNFQSRIPPNMLTFRRNFREHFCLKIQYSNYNCSSFLINMFAYNMSSEQKAVISWTNNTHIHIIFK